MIEEYLAWLIGLEFIIAGIVKVGFPKRTAHDAFRWGYTKEFLYGIAALEILGGVAMFFPPAVLWVSLIFMTLMLGALWTSIAQQHWWEVIHPGVTLVALMVLILLVR